MLVMVALPVQLMDFVPGPKYSIIAFVPPDTVSSSATLSMISFGAVHPFSLPVSLTPIFFGYNSSQGIPAMASAASSPPTPTAIIPRPPAFGVCESVPIISPPGNA